MDRAKYLKEYYLLNKKSIIDRVKARQDYIKQKKILEKPKMEKIFQTTVINFKLY